MTVSARYRATMIDADGRIRLGLACRWCGREDQPTDARCNGCGAPHVASVRVEVTRLGDRQPQHLWIPS